MYNKYGDHMKKIIILFVLIFTGCGYDQYKMPKDAYIDLNKVSFNVFEKHNTNELISKTNTKIISKETLNTNIIGEHKYTIKYKFKKRTYKYDITYNVIDEVKPIFIKYSNQFTVLVNTDEVLCNKIVYADNYDAIPNCKIEGDYDYSKTGKYNLEYVITDSSSNESRKKFILNVVDKVEKNNKKSTPNYIYIDEIKKYKNENTSIGIDVSKWQGNVDFDKVKNAGIEFVIMRIGFSKDPKDKLEIDPKFKEYLKLAKEAGLKISVYVYNTSISEKDAIKTAKWVIKQLDGEKLDLPIAYDWENWSSFNEYKISLHTLSSSYLAFENEIIKAGYESMLYSSKYYLENVWLDYDNSNIWLAHYTNKTDYKGKYMLWQMTSLAKIDGITDNTVDIDILYKNNYTK